MMGASPTAVAALLAAALLSLGGCGDDDPPPPPPSSSTPTSPSPTTSSPTSQAESAEEFIRRWVDEDIKMQNSGVTEAYVALSKPCEACMDFARTIKSYYAAGGFVETKGWAITAVEEVPGGSARLSTYVIDVNSSPTRYKTSSNGRLKTLPGEATRYRVTLRATDESWLVTELLEVA